MGDQLENSLGYDEGLYVCVPSTQEDGGHIHASLGLHGSDNDGLLIKGNGRSIEKGSKMPFATRHTLVQELFQFMSPSEGQ